jgi:nuclear respiratory factor 1
MNVNFTIGIKKIFVHCRKLRLTIEEYSCRVGQQAVVLCCTPNVSHAPSVNQSMQMYKVFGSQPLENVVSYVNALWYLLQF